MKLIIIFFLLFFNLFLINGQSISRPLLNKKVLVIDTNTYIKVGKHITNCTDEFKSSNSKLIEENKKIYYIVLDDSLKILKKIEVIPMVMGYTIYFENDSLVYSKDLDKFMNKDSILPLKAQLFTLGFYWNGKYVEYYQNGKVKIIGRYKENKKIGVWKTYSETGKKLSKEKFKRRWWIKGEDTSPLDL